MDNAPSMANLPTFSYRTEPRSLCKPLHDCLRSTPPHQMALRQRSSALLQPSPPTARSNGTLATQPAMSKVMMMCIATFVQRALGASSSLNMTDKLRAAVYTGYIANVRRSLHHGGHTATPHASTCLPLRPRDTTKNCQAADDNRIRIQPPPFYLL